jgi:uncharacterized protein YdhG (YjbR/CyaY superfamily)
MTKRDGGTTSSPAATVDDYLAAVPEEMRVALENLRKTIKAAAPEATETISYRIPTFKHQGPLVAFSAATNHCAFHLMSPPLMAARKDELKGYDTTTSTIRFTHDKPLPAALVKGLVKARIAENEARTSG